MQAIPNQSMMNVAVFDLGEGASACQAEWWVEMASASTELGVSLSVGFELRVKKLKPGLGDDLDTSRWDVEAVFDFRNEARVMEWLAQGVDPLERAHAEESRRINLRQEMPELAAFYDAKAISACCGSGSEPGQSKSL